MYKMDRQGARTPAQLEQKYRFGKTFAEFEEKQNEQSEKINTLTQIGSSNALIGEVTGNKVVIRDISPIEHILTVKLISNTEIDFTAVKVSRYGETETENLEIYTPRADGGISNVKSLYPITKLTTDTEGVVIRVTYNRDLNKAL